MSETKIIEKTSFYTLYDNGECVITRTNLGYGKWVTITHDKIKYVKAPKLVHAILVFRDCPSLISVSLPNHESSVSFSNCPSLISVSLPKEESTVTFSDCPALTDRSIVDELASRGVYVKRFGQCCFNKVKMSDILERIKKSSNSPFDSNRSFAVHTNNVKEDNYFIDFVSSNPLFDMTSELKAPDGDLRSDYFHFVIAKLKSGRCLVYSSEEYSKIIPTDFNDIDFDIVKPESKEENPHEQLLPPANDKAKKHESKLNVKVGDIVKVSRGFSFDPAIGKVVEIDDYIVGVKITSAKDDDYKIHEDCKWFYKLTNVIEVISRVEKTKPTSKHPSLPMVIDNPDVQSVPTTSKVVILDWEFEATPIKDA